MFTKKSDPRERAVDFLRSMEWKMGDRAWEDNESGWDDETSAAKEKYGDAWLLIHGITSGYQKMLDSRRIVSDGDAGLQTLVSDEKWQEHYDEYGYGTYGDGLEIGKRLFSYNPDNKFSIDPELAQEKNDTDESRFTIKSYDD